MWRKAIGRTPTLVEGQTKDMTPKANAPPWTSLWWQPSGIGAALFYIVIIHALALVGLILFPLPGWSVLDVALAVAAIVGKRYVAGALIGTSSDIGFGGRCKFPSSYFPSSRVRNDGYYGNGDYDNNNGEFQKGYRDVMA